MAEVYIKYGRVRTLGEILNASLHYFLSNFKSIFSALLFYVMPFIFASTLASYYFTSSAVSLPKMIAIITHIKQHKPVEVILIIIPFLLALVLQNQIMNRHLLLNEELSEGKPVQVKNFRHLMLEDFKQHFSNYFFLLLTVILCAVVVTFAVGGLVKAEYLTFDWDQDPFNFTVQIIVSVCIIGIVLPLFCFFICASLFFSFREKTGIFESLNKVWGYAKDKLFVTWAISIIALFIAYILHLLFKIPVYLVYYLCYVFIDTFHSLNPAIYMLLELSSMFFVFFISGLFLLIATFQFTSLEERKDGISIQNKINNI